MGTIHFEPWPVAALYFLTYLLQKLPFFLFPAFNFPLRCCIVVSVAPLISILIISTHMYMLPPLLALFSAQIPTLLHINCGLKLRGVEPGVGAGNKNRPLPRPRPLSLQKDFFAAASSLPILCAAHFISVGMSLLPYPTLIDIVYFRLLKTHVLNVGQIQHR